MPRPDPRASSITPEQLAELQRLVDELTAHNDLCAKATAHTAEMAAALQQIEKDSAAAIGNAQGDHTAAVTAEGIADEAVKQDVAALNEFMANLAPPAGK